MQSCSCFSCTQVRDRIHDVVQQIKAMHPRTIIQAAFVGYRDYEDWQKILVSGFFRGDSVAASLQAFAAKVQATGGDDLAEDVFSGLEAVAKLSWSSAGTRLLIHIADAPMHGIRFHEEGFGDNYPNGDKYQRSISAILRTLQIDCKIEVGYTYLYFLLVYLKPTHFSHEKMCMKL